MPRFLPLLLLLLLLPADAAAAEVLPAMSALIGLAAAGLALAGWAGWQLWRLRRRLAAVTAEVARLAASEAALRAALEAAEARVRLFDGVFEALPDGIAVVDADHRLVCWNTRFPEVTGVPRRMLRVGLSFAELVRRQAEAGEFGLVDPDAETERRMRLLREGKMMGRWQRERPDGSRVELRRAPLPGGGFVTLYSPLGPAEEAKPADLVEALRADWSARVPRLIAAAADGDPAAVKAAAHALRGIAANAGWTGMVAQLVAVEEAADRGDLREARTVASLLLTDRPW